MSQALPVAYLVRHGETEWSAAGKHTGRTDIPLTAQGEEHARHLGPRLAGRPFPIVWTSPLQRAAETCRLAGFAERAETLPDLTEWDYGEYEGKFGDDIRAARPGWNLFQHGAAGGESPADVAARADRVLDRFRQLDEDVLIFSSGHLLRVLAARFVGLGAEGGGLFRLDTASISCIGYDHDRTEPAIRFWNLTEA
ncbi:MAG TPA: histidine phosphatase family protein [Pirellulaceae bacterium]|jgi:probable phosphoglycerate mutase|nr:histidine phosphatase family protein [Pirellulaceae bacterium]